MDLERMRISLKNNELDEFYDVASKLEKKIEKTRTQAGSYLEKDAAAAQEWFLYYVVIAPHKILPQKDFRINKMFGIASRSKGDIEILFSSAHTLAGMLGKEDHEQKIANLIGVEGKRLKELRELRFAWIRQIFRTIHRARREADIVRENVQREEKWMWSLSCKEYLHLKRRDLENGDDFSKELLELEEVAALMRFDHWRMLGIYRSASSRSEQCEKNAIIFGWRFMRKLIEIYPAQPIRIQKNIRDLGYKSDEAYLRYLSKIVPRKTEYAEFYHGLPTERDLMEAEAKKTISAWVEYAKKFPEIQRNEARILGRETLSYIAKANDVRAISDHTRSFEDTIAAIEDSARTPKEHESLRLQLEKDYDNYLTRQREALDRFRNSNDFLPELMRVAEAAHETFKSKGKNVTRPEELGRLDHIFTRRISILRDMGANEHQRRLWEQEIEKKRAASSNKSQNQ
jgi:hypothetical protein